MSTTGRSPILAIILGLVKFGFQQKESVQKLSDPSATVERLITQQTKEKKASKAFASILKFRRKESYNTPLPPILLSLIHSMLVTNNVQQVNHTLAVQKVEQMKRVAMIESQRRAAEQVALVR